MQYADYSAGRPSGKALWDNGFRGAIRYIGMGSAGKKLIASEYVDLVQTFGADNVLLVVELGTGDSWGSATDDDYARGRAYAQAGLNEARAAGVPDWVGIAAASDAHAGPQWQITDTVNYVRGFRDVLGLARTGHYGFVETNVAVHNAGMASWYWRCGSEPSGRWEPTTNMWTGDKAWVNFWQKNNPPDNVRYAAGIQCDVNEVYHPFAGGNDMFEQPDRDMLRALKDVLVNQRHSMVPDAGPNDNFDTGQYVVFIDNATNQTFRKADAIAAELANARADVAAVRTELAALKAAFTTPTVDLDALAIKVAAQLKTLQFKA